MCTKASEGTGGKPALVAFSHASVSCATQPHPNMRGGQKRFIESSSQMRAAGRSLPGGPCTSR